MTERADRRSWDPVVPLNSLPSSEDILNPEDDPPCLTTIPTKRDDGAATKGLKHANGNPRHDDDLKSPRSSRSAQSAWNDSSAMNEVLLQQMQVMLKESFRKELSEMSSSLRKDIVGDIQALDIIGKKDNSFVPTWTGSQVSGNRNISIPAEKDSVSTALDKKTKRSSLRRKLEHANSLGDLATPIKRFMKTSPSPSIRPSLKRASTHGNQFSSPPLLEKQRTRKFSMVNELLGEMMVGREVRSESMDKAASEDLARLRKSSTRHEMDFMECRTIESGVEVNHQKVWPMSGSSSQEKPNGESDKAGDRRATKQKLAEAMRRCVSNPDLQSAFTEESTIVTGTTCAEVEQVVQETLQHCIEDSISIEVKPCGRLWWRRVVDTHVFDYVISIFIVINAITVGIQTDYSIRHLDEGIPIRFRILEMIFCTIFTLEVGLRLFVYGLEFFTNYENKWNIFDFVVVTIQLTEEILTACVQGDSGSADVAEISDNVNFIRILRLLRLVRIIRLVRLLKFLVELRTMVCSIVASFRTLFWTIMLLLFMIYVASVYLTQVVADFGHSEREKYEKERAFQMYYGSLLRSVLTLFQAMTGGVDWDDLVRPMTDNISPLMAVVFSMYICFAVLAMMNVITGVFVESALMTAKEDKEAQLLSQIRRLFQRTDQDHSGTISWEEFQSRCDQKDMERYFKALDIDISEARGLFTLLDTDNSGEVDMEEFVMGCLRLRGPAKAIDLAAMMYFNKRMASRTQKHFIFIESQIDDVLDLIEAVKATEEEVAAEMAAAERSQESRLSMRSEVFQPMEHGQPIAKVPSMCSNTSSILPLLPQSFMGGLDQGYSTRSSRTRLEDPSGNDGNSLLYPSAQRRQNRCFSYGRPANFPSLGGDSEGARPLRSSRRKITEDLKEDIALATWADLKAHGDKKATSNNPSVAPSRRASAVATRKNSESSVNGVNSNVVGMGLGLHGKAASHHYFSE